MNKALCALLSVLVTSGLFASNNKRLTMHYLYYLPFSMEFKVGSTKDEIIPIANLRSGEKEVIASQELRVIDQEWNKIRMEWRKTSLLLHTEVAINQSQRISQKLISHRIPTTRGPFDKLPITEQIALNELVKKKTPEVQKTFRQLWFVKSFLQEADLDRPNLLVVSPSWCESSREYRILLEYYLKSFPDFAIRLHSIVVDDPKEEIFDSRLVADLFPNKEKYSHEIFPRFITIEKQADKMIILEEADALSDLYERFLKSHSGFLSDKISFFSKVSKKPSRHNATPGRRKSF